VSKRALLGPPYAGDMLYVFLGMRDQRLLDAVGVALGHPKPDDLNFTRLHGRRTDTDALLAACGSVSLFGERRKVFLDDAQVIALRRGRAQGAEVTEVEGDADEAEEDADEPVAPASSTGRATVNTKFFEALADIAHQPHVDVALAAIIDVDDNRNRARVARFTALKEHGAQVREFGTLKEEAATKFVQSRARAEGVTISSEGSRLLVELIGGHPGLLTGEVAKLAAFVGFAGAIDTDAVYAVCDASGQHGRFDYVNAVRDRRPDRALAILHDLLELNAPPQMILSDLALWLRQAATAHAALGPDGDEPAAVGALHRMGTQNPYAVTTAIQEAQGISVGLLDRMLAHLVRADLDLKSTGGDDAALLEILTLRLASRPGRRARPARVRPPTKGEPRRRR